MYTIGMLRRTLGLSTDNQVRNRIEQIKDLLVDHIRRGPNNQLFLTEPGLSWLRQLQELHESGLTLTEASGTVRASANIERTNRRDSVDGFVSNERKRGEASPSRDDLLAEEMAQLRAQIQALVYGLEQLRTLSAEEPQVQRWWLELREDLDVA